MTVVLASGSPRRLELLRVGGVAPVVRPTDVDETPRPGESPVALVRRLAREKATVGAATSTDAVVVAADTEVVRDGNALGKPRDEADARAMLLASSGRVLGIWTGVAVAAGGSVTTRVVGSFLRFRDLTPVDVEDYVATGEPVGVAGGFRVQGAGAALVAARTGCWTNVVGLPTCQTARLLAPHGVVLRSDDCGLAS